MWAFSATGCMKQHPSKAKTWLPAWGSSLAFLYGSQFKPRFQLQIFIFMFAAAPPQGKAATVCVLRMAALKVRINVWSDLPTGGEVGVCAYGNSTPVELSPLGSGGLNCHPTLWLKLVHHIPRLAA